MGRLVSHGEIRWYQFTRPDKRRPVLVLTRTTAIEYLGETTIAPITRTIRDIPSEVIVGPEDGLPEECAVNLDHVQTVSKGKIGALITTLGDDKMKKIRQALLFALDF
jgi:mRNA interferase MazF